MLMLLVLRHHLSPPTNSAAYQRATSVINSPWSSAAEYIAPAAPAIHSMWWSQILAQNCNFCLPNLQKMPSLGESPLEYPMTFGTEKLEWCGYPMVKKFCTYIYSFWQNPQMWWTHTTWWHRPRLRGIAWQKWWFLANIWLSDRRLVKCEQQLRWSTVQFAAHASVNLVHCNQHGWPRWREQSRI